MRGEVTHAPRHALLLLALCVFATVAGAQDSQPSTSIVPWDEWQTRVDAIRARDGTTLERTDELKAAAQGVLVERRGKILDMKPVQQGGRETVSVSLCGVHDEEPLWTFVVKADERPATAEWKRWDRIAWTCTVHVRELTDVRYLPIYNGIADVTRTPDPGPETPPIRGDTGTAAQFRTWLYNYSQAVFKAKWDMALKLVTDGRATTWVIPGTVIDLGPDGGPLVHFDGDVRIATPRSNRAWGIIEESLPIRVADPQLRPLVRAGTKVELLARFVADHLKAPGDVQACDGKFGFDIRFWRIKTPK